MNTNTNNKTDMGVSLSKLDYIQSEKFNQDSKVFAKKIKNTKNYDKMDTKNKEIMDVWEKGGVNVAVKEMFKDGDKSLSYGDMRTRYG